MNPLTTRSKSVVTIRTSRPAEVQVGQSQTLVTSQINPVLDENLNPVPGAFDVSSIQIVHIIHLKPYFWNLLGFKGFMKIF